MSPNLTTRKALGGAATATAILGTRDVLESGYPRRRMTVLDPTPDMLPIGTSAVKQPLEKSVQRLKTRVRERCPAGGRRGCRQPRLSLPSFLQHPPSAAASPPRRPAGFPCCTEAHACHTFDPLLPGSGADV